MWGGHPEIRALSCTLGLPITVYQEGAHPLHIAPTGKAETFKRTGAYATRQEVALRLSFHKHYYALGEHYNSVVDVRGGS